MLQEKPEYSGVYPPVRFGYHKWYQGSTLGIEAKTQWWQARILTTQHAEHLDTKMTKSLFHKKDQKKKK